MSQALAGVRVLDLTNVLAGPFCAYQLALLGADVIKIEVPEGGDLARQLGADADLERRHMGASFLAQNAGKKSVTLNLKTAEGKDVLRRLVAIGRRPGRELPARRDGAARPVLSGAQADQPEARLLRHLGLRPGRADERRAGLRPDHPGPVGNDERDRHPRERAAAQRLSGRRYLGRDDRRVRHRQRAGAAQRARGEGAFIDVSMLDSALDGDGLGGVQLPDRRGRAAAAWQRQLHRRAVGRVQGPGRPDQHRRQQAGAVRGAGAGRSAAKTWHAIRALPSARTARRTGAS